MKFCIALISYWTEKGYNTQYWRKSIDGTKAMCHLEYGEILAKGLEDNPNVQVFDVIDEDFQALLNSSEWREDGTDEVVEDTSHVKKLNQRIEDLEIAIAELMHV